MKYHGTIGTIKEDDMRMTRLNIQLPVTLKTKLDVLKEQGTSAAGLIRHLLTQHFNAPKAAMKGG